MSKYVVAIIVGFVAAFAVSFGLRALLTAAGDAQSPLPLGLGVLVGLFTTYIMANLAGNRSVMTADAATKARALELKPPAGKALIIAYREGFVGRAAGLDIAIDGEAVAQLTSPRFTCVAVSPGQHTLSAGFGGLAGAQNADSVIPVTLAEGQIAAFRYGVTLGLVQNTIAATAMTDLEAVRRRLAKLPMTLPEMEDA